ncbi:MAG: Bifunctional synthase/transferase [Candidatus Moranbacteria bacterium GW2011_GWC2_37_8]|nr:MAG: Bifunctional synthase/transferase [Candidatus Moranbacteria bacterium GW2011_GWC2_37_8]KKQ63370.1 MAG: Bifunctional synthase/transferase [Parcubacteria group bacterium GW2011_GWC1_38_22]KKQ80963.1 MAG: Bifunctional synthase/transferase [Candidatus Moranbacteria bacterium GW2011_GWD2_38_7]
MDIEISSLLGSGKLIPSKEIGKISILLKKNGYRVVLTQGVWDLIHEGHAQYLHKAKQLGDVLIVGVDTDEVVRHRKGPTRPIVPQEERVKMISHLRPVDLIVMKESKTDHGRLIRDIQPDIFVISETTPPNVDGKTFLQEVREEHKEYCKEIINMEPQSTTSTTARIRLLTIKGAEDLAKELQEVIAKFLYKK